MPSAHIAIDLGASSGRAVLGVLDGPSEPTLEIEEVHRFEHLPLDAPEGPVWDFTGIVRQVLTGLRLGNQAARRAGLELASVGVDTWGVDFGMVTDQGDLVGLPRCYRDPTHSAARDDVLRRIDGGAETLYGWTGIQPLAFNTLFQLCGRLRQAPELVPASGHLLLLPDLIHFWLSGRVTNERTIASTGGWLSAASGDWDFDLLQQVGVPVELLGGLCSPGTPLGSLRIDLARNLGIRSQVEVVAPATHDTASAIAAAPATGHPPGAWAYLSSGTWSLLGVELTAPITTVDALRAGFTNEIGVDVDGRPSVRFLRNIGGLWLIQELQRDLASQGKKISFQDLVSLAEKVEPFRTIIDPNADDLSAPGQSVAKLQRHAAESNQPVPNSPGELARCCLESLAMCYAETLDRLETIAGVKIEVLHAVGGGIQNTLLNRLTAAAINRPVMAGPVEATAVGNLLVQAMGLGRVRDVRQLREIVARSFPVETITPCPEQADWLSQRQRYSFITAHSA